MPSVHVAGTVTPAASAQVATRLPPTRAPAASTGTAVRSTVEPTRTGPCGPLTATAAIVATVNESVLLTTAPNDTVTFGESAFAPSRKKVTAPSVVRAPTVAVSKPVAPAMLKPVVAAKAPG